MSFKKRLLKHPTTQSLLAFLLAGYIRLVYWTSHRTLLIHEASKPFMRGDGNAIFAFWHGRMMMCPTICPPKHQMRVLISFHRDGLLISQVIGHFNQATVSGSSSKGGQVAVMEMLRALENDDNISITPDGPRGPIQVAEKGIVTVARLSGKVVLPVTFSTTRCKRLRSWDRFMLALPFGHIVFAVGEPIVISKDGDEEQGRLMIENAMNALVKHADGITHA